MDALRGGVGWLTGTTNNNASTASAGSTSEKPKEKEQEIFNSRVGSGAGTQTGTGAGSIFSASRPEHKGDTKETTAFQNVYTSKEIEFCQILRDIVNALCDIDNVEQLTKARQAYNVISSDDVPSVASLGRRTRLGTSLHLELFSLKKCDKVTKNRQLHILFYMLDLFPKDVQERIHRKVPELRVKCGELLKANNMYRPWLEKDWKE